MLNGLNDYGYGCFYVMFVDVICNLCGLNCVLGWCEVVELNGMLVIVRLMLLRLWLKCWCMKFVVFVKLGLVWVL